MKSRIFSYIFIMLFGFIFIVSCNNGECDVVVQPRETPVCFIVTDNEGNNLLDPLYDGNILDRNIMVEYEGEQYSLELSEYPNDGKFGLYTGKIDIGTDKMQGIKFWYFYVSKNKGSHDFSISWGDGTADEVKIDYYYKVVDCEPVIYMRAYLDGELHSDNSFIINLVK